MLLVTILNRCLKFRHLVGSRNGQCIAYFIIDYNVTNPIDLHVELQCFNNILSEHDINGVWNKIQSFEVKEKDVFNFFFNMSCYSNILLQCLKNGRLLTNF